MANLIRVTPDQLKTAAGTLGDQIGQYTNWQAKLYADVDSLKSTWSGEANQSFTTQIEGFRNDFQKLEQLLKDYMSFINDSASEYQRVESELAGAAKSLSTGY